MKITKTKNSIVLATSLLLANSAFAETSSQSGVSDLGAGDWLLGFSGSYSHVSADGDSLDLFTAHIDFTYFVEDHWSVGLNTFGILVPSTGDVDDTGYALGLEPNLRYYFHSEASYLPYVGIHGGFAYLDVGDESEAVGTYGLHAGLLIPMTKNAYFDAQIKWTEFDVSDDGEDLDLSTVQLLLGFKIKF